jgi:uncharacterized membrane protein YeaQ/YmgE (transglycosylase-associated protein family)
MVSMLTTRPRRPQLPRLNKALRQRNLTRAHESERRPQTTHGFAREGGIMHISNEGLVVVLIVGIVAGWLAGQLVQGTGFGLIGDLIIGVVGAIIGSWLFPQLGIRIGSGIVGAIVAATIGAVLLLIVLRVLRRRGRW